MKILNENFPDTQFYKVVTNKKIIVLHHTVSGSGVGGDINWWKVTPERVGTPFIIDRNGTITQIFDEKYWIHHLGIKQYMLNQFGSNVSNQKLNELSIGIEIDNWGGLVKKNGDWYASSGEKISCDKVQEYPKGFRGFYAFEKYTAEQIQAASELILFLSKKHDIPLNYFIEMWDFNSKALKGYHGIWSHVSFRPDKSDCHPQPELDKMLREICLK